MTLQEAYDKALKADGKYASVDESKQTDGCGTLTTYSVRCGSMFAHSFESFEDCFAQIAAMDPAKARADKIAELKAKLADLES